MQEQHLLDGIKDGLEASAANKVQQSDPVDPTLLWRARELQREEAAGAAARSELQKLSREGKKGVSTAVKELDLLIKERTTLLKEDITEDLWTRDIHRRVLEASPPRHLVDQLREIQSPPRKNIQYKDVASDTVLETPKSQQTRITDPLMGGRETPSPAVAQIPSTVTPSMTPSRNSRAAFSPSVLVTPQNASRIEVTQQGLWSPGDLWPETCGGGGQSVQRVPSAKYERSRWSEQGSAPPERGVSAAATASPPPPTPPSQAPPPPLDPIVVSFANYLNGLPEKTSITHRQIDSAFELLKQIRKEQR
eukprot:TRINITY_DN27641_c0_g1_i1.p1 TRINITY_DN27641_c0_g1~~TRINITY_DN27641_c0_g1_i1.p1  ORF type:complete len:307 (+),score=61.31 TRINITY_DN27641_c0_g1_i1:69-989(+)